MTQPFGWLTDAEADCLAELAGRGGHILEIGAYHGRSTVVLAKAAKGGLVWSVDPHEGIPGIQDGAPSWQAFLHSLKTHQATNVLAIRETSARARDLLSQLTGLQFGLIFIDGDHSREAVEEDIHLWLPLLAPDGRVAFHDYSERAYPGVAAAVDASPLEGACGPGSLWVGRLPERST